MDKIKDFVSNDTLFYATLVTLVAVTAYGLGLRAATVPVSTSVSSASVTLAPSSPVQSTEGEILGAESEQVVASKNGTKYHFLWCPGAGQMKEENKVFFASTDAARAAGYAPAANCPGLE